MAAAVSVRAYRGRVAASARLGRSLAIAGLSFVLAHLAAKGAAAAPASPMGAAWAVLAGIASLGLCHALVTLALHDARGRGWIANLAFGALAAAMLISSGTSFLALVAANLALARWRGPRASAPAGRWDFAGARWAMPGAAAIVAAQILIWLLSHGETRGSTLSFVSWMCALTALQAAQELPAITRAAALSVRQVGRRLTLLFVLAAFVPLTLTGALWALTTWLGVSSEDALIGARELRECGLMLERALPTLDGPDRDRAAAVRAWQSAWPGAQLWWRPAAAAPDAREAMPPGSRWRQLAGRDPIDPGALDAWIRSDTAWVGVIGARSYLVAADDAPDRSRMVALAPVAPLLAERISRVVGVQLALETQFPGLPTAAAPDSARQNSRWVITRRGESLMVATPSTGIFNGRATLPAGVWTNGRWEIRFALLAALNDPYRIFLGLYRDVRENPFVFLPLALLFSVLSVFVFVLVFDFRMVRDLGRSVAGAVSALREGTAALERGDLSRRIEVRGRDDLWEVASAFNRMAAGLERARELEAEQRRVEAEFSIARRIQARLLPGEPPRVKGLEIFGTSESAREVGGDYYDHFLLPDGRVALAIADVSGKGVGAALLMSAVRAALITQPVAGESPAQVLARIHRFLCSSVEPGRFVTAVLAFLDPGSGALQYCNAGHNPPLVIERGGALARLETGGLALGVLEGARYEDGAGEVPHGALLALYTDGVTEAQAPSDELWGEEPLIEALTSGRDLPLATLGRHVIQAMRSFEAGRAASDDVTLLLARRG